MSVAKSYAGALYQALKDSGGPGKPEQIMDQMEDNLEQFSSLLEKSKELKTALLSPVTTVREKLSLVEKITEKPDSSPLFKQFLLLLVRKGRLGLFKEIQDAFNVVRLAQEGGIAGNLIAAEALSDADVASLAQSFTRKLGKKVAFRVTTDPSLLAGMKVTVNGVTYDGTLRSQLLKLRDRFVAGVPGVHE